MTVDPDTIFDCQIKRIHEYKRQLLNALRIVVLYNRLRRKSGPEDAAANVLLRRQGRPGLPAGQAHHQVHQQPGRHHRRRPGGRAAASRSCSCPNTDVSLAERLIPASDVSNQISTAGYEASGTSNMKFMMNGALTIGTRDGATIEMAEEAGEENFFLFGLTAEQVAQQPELVQPALALRERAGDARRAGPDLLRSLQPQRAGRLRAAARHAADARRPLHAPGGPEFVPGGGPAAARTLCRPRRLGAQGHPERRRLGKVLQRPHHRRICQPRSGT